MSCLLIKCTRLVTVTYNSFEKKFNYFFLLVKIKIDGHEIPNVLPEHLIPPSKRHLANNASSSSGNNGLYPTINNSGYN